MKWLYWNLKWNCYMASLKDWVNLHLQRLSYIITTNKIQDSEWMPKMQRPTFYTKLKPNWKYNCPTNLVVRPKSYLITTCPTWNSQQGHWIRVQPANSCQAVSNHWLLEPHTSLTPRKTHSRLYSSPSLLFPSFILSATSSSFNCSQKIIFKLLKSLPLFDPLTCITFSNEFLLISDFIPGQ